jgi:hypothetical protein
MPVCISSSAHSMRAFRSVTRAHACTRIVTRSRAYTVTVYLHAYVHAYPSTPSRAYANTRVREYWRPGARARWRMTLLYVRISAYIHRRIRARHCVPAWSSSAHHQAPRYTWAQAGTLVQSHTRIRDYSHTCIHITSYNFVVMQPPIINHINA